MKKWFIPIGILAVLFIGGYFGLTFYAVRFIQPRLQRAIGPGFTLEEIKLKATCLSARGIRYEDPDSKLRFFQVKEIRVYPSLLSLLGKSIRIRELEILQPSFFFYRSREGRVVGSWFATRTESSQKEIAEKKEKGREPVSFRIDRIRIQKGSIDFEDEKVGEPPAQIKLRDMDFEMKNVEYPIASVHSPVRFDAKMGPEGRGGSIGVEGWIDPRNMDMETTLKIREIEVKTFEPYYRKRVTAEIESGYVDMDSKIVVTKGRMDAPGELGLINLRVKEEGGMVFWIPADTLGSLLERRGHQIKAKFYVKGNVENPQFSLQETFLTQVAIALAQALGIPVKVVDGEVLQGTLKGEKGLVEGLRSMEGLFKKKKEKRK